VQVVRLVLVEYLHLLINLQLFGPHSLAIPKNIAMRAEDYSLIDGSLNRIEALRS
jgi:hypothetical protein